MTNKREPFFEGTSIKSEKRVLCYTEKNAKRWVEEEQKSKKNK